MDKIKPEDCYYYDNVSESTTYTSTTGSTLILEPKINIMPLIERINQIIDRLEKAS